MRVLKWLLPALAATVLSGCLATSAQGQDPYGDYNRARAYRHFLNSPYATRTFSSGTPGYGMRYATPWEYGETRVSPTYHHERITPRGHERYQTLPEVSSYTVQRPLWLEPAVILPPPGRAPLPPLPLLLPDR